MVKKNVYVSLEEDDLAWIEDRVYEGKFKSISDAVRIAVTNMIQNKKKVQI